MLKELVPFHPIWILRSSVIFISILVTGIVFLVHEYDHPDDDDDFYPSVITVFVISVIVVCYGATHGIGAMTDPILCSTTPSSNAAGWIFKGRRGSL